MAGTKSGGKAAAATNKAKYGDDFYRKIGLKTHDAWVKNGRKPRGFAYNPELASRVGKIGGRKSRRK